MANQSRRGFLAYLGLAGATTAAASVTAITIAPAAAPKEERGRFESPADYLVAMRAIGWEARAMFHPLQDGGVHCMGVHESGGTREHIEATWERFHVIQMRCPVQLPADVHPPKGWWRAVWEHLYDQGLREDVTPQRVRDREAGYEA
jgi:hypothetical protein